MWIKRIFWGTYNFNFLQEHNTHTHTSIFICLFPIVKVEWIPFVTESEYFDDMAFLTLIMLEMASIKALVMPEKHLWQVTIKEKQNPQTNLLWSRSSERLLGWSLDNLAFVCVVVSFVQLQRGCLILSLWWRLRGSWVFTKCSFVL